MVHVYVFIEMIFNMGIFVRVDNKIYLWVDNKNNFLCCALASQNILTVMVIIHFSYSAIMIIACFKEGNFPLNSFFSEVDYCLQFFQ